MTEEFVSEKQSSVEVAENAKGQKSFKIKIYYDDSIREGTDVVDSIKKIQDKLHETFG